MTRRAIYRSSGPIYTPHPNSALAQRSRVLDWLRKQPLSTIDAREQIAVMHPAARVMELRHAGHIIVTVRSRETAADGTTHRVARYVLQGIARGTK